MKKIKKSRLLAINRSKVMVLEKLGEPIRYTLPGGVKKRKETMEQALIRETSEEIELKLKEKKIHFFMSVVKRTDAQQVNKNYYYTFLDKTKFEVLEKDKFKTVTWLKWKKAVRYMDKSDRIAVKIYFKNIRRKEQIQKNYEGQISSRIAL